MREAPAVGMTEIACNLCGSSRQHTIFPAGLAQPCRVARCDDCGLMFASPRAKSDVDDIVQWDPDEVYAMVKRDDTDRVEKQMLQRRDYEPTRRFLAERHSARGRMVEVGSSLGYLLDFFRKDGWDVLGAEPNGGFALYAQRELGIPVITGTLDQAQIESHSVDAMLMMHVIEHVPDPSSLFREVLRVMKKGGTFVLETPRYDSLAFRLLRHRERSVSCDGHIYFFETKTLRAMAERCGFRVLREDYVGRSMTVQRLLYNVGVMSKSKFVANGLRSLSERLGLNRVSLYINARDMERIYLTPA